MTFKSKDFTFRPTALALALQEAGLTNKTHMVREENCSIGDHHLKPKVNTAMGGTPNGEYQRNALGQWVKAA